MYSVYCVVAIWRNEKQKTIDVQLQPVPLNMLRKIFPAEIEDDGSKNKEKFIAFENAFDVWRLASSRCCHNERQMDVREMYMRFWIFYIWAFSFAMCSLLLHISFSTAIRLAHPFFIGFFFDSALSFIIILFEFYVCIHLRTNLSHTQELSQYTLWMYYVVLDWVFLCCWLHAIASRVEFRSA